ncbi:MAG: carbohydrate porin, partial [Verrucomicrobiota bacterium]
MKKYRSLIIAAALAAGASLHAESPVTKWWDGKYATGDWFGARSTLEDHGIIFSGNWKGTYGAVVGGGISRHGAFDEEIHLALKLDFEKLAGIPGLSAFGSVRYRDGDNLNNYAGASTPFTPTVYQGGKQWRFQQAYLTWESRDLFSVENMITISGGWQNPYHFFAQQPESKLFTNSAITQTKGIGANIPFNGTYAAWGGYAKVKPTEWSYLQAGLYAAVPNATNTRNHGLYFELANPPNSNGLYFLTETGVTPKIAGLPGKYAFGSYY